jgi:hypothetical protein
MRGAMTSVFLMVRSVAMTMTVDRSGLFKVLCVAASLAAMSGCSSLVRSRVDTQPRVAIQHGALDDPTDLVRGQPTAYVLAASRLTEKVTDPDLVRFAPVIIQGFQPVSATARYDYWSDGIGTPMLARDGRSVIIETDRPAVFTRIEHCRVDGMSLKQLVYVFWYPRRPVGSIETGDVDGGILRITLDAASRPAVFEYSQPCGCFHGVFVSDALESAAAAEFKTIAPRRVHAAEPPLSGEDDWVVRGLVGVQADARPALFMSAGKHFCEAIAFVRPEDVHAERLREYALQPYDMLASIDREGGGAGSMFNAEGLVVGGRRWKEQLIMGDLDNPGWPRHLDRMRIHWDKEMWVDPTLIQTHLRLPRSMLDRSVVSQNFEVVNPAVSTDGAHRAESVLALLPPPDHGTRGTAILFTNRYCLGCQTVKRDVLPDDRVQKRLSPWTLRVYDTATPEGAAMAAALHVDATPVLTFIDDHGREISRNEDALTVPEMLAGIPQ